MSDFVLDEMTIVPIKNTQSTGYTELSVGTIVEAMQTNNWGNAFVLVDLGDNKPGLYVRFFIIPGNTAYLGTKEYIDHGYWVGVQGSNGNNVYENTNRLIGWDGSKLWISQNQAYFDSKTVDGIAYECVGGNLADYGNQQAFYLPNTIEDIYIDNVLQPKYNVTISVDYTVPQNDYEYVKLVYKENRIPANVTDGKAVDLDPTATTAEITGLKNELGTKYYFVIFTDKSVSDEFSYETGRVWDGSETAILWSGNENKLTIKVDNSHIVFTFYSGDTVIYTFNSIVGTGISDIRKINVSFLIDHDFEVAKPSFIYDNGDSTYSYNQETPTDAEMADIYTWLSAGLPSA